MKAVRLSIVALLLTTIFSTQISKAQKSPETLKKLALESYDALIKHDLTKFGSYLAENAIDYGQGPVPVKGKQAIMAILTDLFGAFPDYTLAVEGVAVDGNKVYVRNTFTGTHSKLLAGMIPPTWKKVVWSDVDILEFDNNGKLVAHWAQNPNALLDQLGYHSFTNPNTQLVMEAYQKFGKGDVAGILEGCSDQIVWNVTDSPSSKVAGVYKGKPEVMNFFKNLMTAFEITKFEPQKFVADGDDVFTTINVEYKYKGNSKLYNAPFIHQFQFKDGKVAMFKELIGKEMEVMMTAK